MVFVDEDQYAVSSDSDDDLLKKPPQKINIEGHSLNDLNKIVSKKNKFFCFYLKKIFFVL